MARRCLPASRARLALIAAVVTALLCATLFASVLLGEDLSSGPHAVLRLLAASSGYADFQRNDDMDMQLTLRDHNHNCTTVLLTNFFMTRTDPQAGASPKHTSKKQRTLDYIEDYYRSVMSVPGGRVKAYILHDGLPESVTKEYTPADGAVTFVKVDISNMDQQNSVNDLRFHAFLEQLEAHPEWDTVFMSDASDVVVVHNPCVFVNKQPDKIYACAEPSDLAGNGYMKMGYNIMGGKYLNWWTNIKKGQTKIINAGLVGGKREKLLPFLRLLSRTIADQDMPGRKKSKSININMAALNWALFQVYSTSDLVTGEPLHTKFKGYSQENDVYFRHK